MTFEKKIESGYYETELLYGSKGSAREAYNLDHNRLLAEFKYDARMFLIEGGVPEMYVDNVYKKAWEDGHAHGFTEILSEMYGLIGIFDMS